MKIGIIQQHNTADIADNKSRLAVKIADLAKAGAELIVLQELHNGLYFCQVEDVNNFDLAETIPGPSTAFFGELAKEYGVVIVTSSSSAGLPDSIITPPSSWRRTGILRASTGRCIYPMTRGITRSSISHPAT